MCGIVGYVGKQTATRVLLQGLQRLEYRGYDSAGVALLLDGLQTVRAKGKVAALAEKIAGQPALAAATIGIAHTRWATHGAPNEINAHPHMDDSGRFAVVHNGIIENHAELRARLERHGHVFKSQTDTEVIPHLIRHLYQGDLAAAVAASLKQLEGTYGIAVISSEHPGQIVVARKGSPIVIGVGTDETIIGSDITAIVAHTNNVIYLEDKDIAVVTADRVDVRNVDLIAVEREVALIDWDLGAIEKGGYAHFMLKEIMEQPDALRNSTRGRLDHDLGTASLGGLKLSARDMAAVQRIVIAACGTSMHAGMVGEYFFEDLAHIPTEVEQAAEFRYRNPIIDANTLTVAISQSGETADTLAAVREAQMKGSTVCGICNAVGSTIARECGRGIYLHAGPEIGVASTKAFTCQVTVLLLMALKFGRGRRLTREEAAAITAEIEALPELVQIVLDRDAAIAAIAEKWAHKRDYFFIGRGYLFPVAMEGALKLKEISYVHAEGYHAAELKHGPIALLEPDLPVIALANDIPGKDKTLSNIQECRARSAPVIATATDGDTEVPALTEDIIWLPRTSRYLAPITTTVALQLLAYHIARIRGCEIDQPRNLAKSVTVE